MKTTDPEFEVPGSGARWRNRTGSRISLLAAVCFAVISTVTRPAWTREPAGDDGSGTGSVQEGEEAQGNVARFGPPELLAEKLIRSRDTEGLLGRLRTDPSGVLPETTVDALLNVFAAPADVFLNDTSDRPVSACARARQWLLDSDRAVQRAWDAAAGPRAAAELDIALQSGNAASLAGIVRKFPLTTPALKAQTLALIKDRLKSNHVDAGAVERLIAGYRGTHLESLAMRYATLIQAAAPEARGSGPSRLSLDPVPMSADVSPPWPVQLWSWHEQTWTFPGAPQPDAGTVLDAIDVSLPGSNVWFSNWKPILWGSDLVLRSPFRLVGLDPLKGTVRWFLPTSTYRSPDAREVHPGEDAMFSVRDAGDHHAQLRSAAWGTLSADSEYLYFVDRFDLFEHPEVSDPLSRRGVAFRESDESPSEPPFAQASRLVALRRASGEEPPIVAWTIGETGSFHYSVFKGAGLADVAAVQDRPAIAEDAGDGTSGERDPEAADDFPDLQSPVELPVQLVAGSVTGHRFLHAPATRGEQLFVLTHAGEQYWLNRLERSSGRVVWQQPVCFSNESPEDDFAGSPTAGPNVCLIADDVVICCLQNGFLVGVRADDGRLVWACTVQDEPHSSPVPGFGIPQRFRLYKEPSAIVMLPALAGRLVIASHFESQFVTAVDARTGEIVWRSPVSPQGLDEGRRNSAHLIAGVLPDRVILSGEHYCRSLDLETGRENWLVELDAIGGRPECGQRFCLVPLTDGRVQVIDVQSGSLVRAPSVMDLPDHLPTGGAVSGNEDVVVLSSPVSAMAFARSAVLQQATLPDWLAAGVRDHDHPVFRRAQSLLMTGDVEGAQQLLESEMVRPSRVDESDSAQLVRQEIQTAYAELVLQSWGQDLESSWNGDVSQSAANRHDQDRRQTLSRKLLRPDQELRAAVLSLLERPVTPLDRETLARLASTRDWNRPVLIHSSWRTRPDRLLEERFPGAASSEAASGFTVENISRKAARERASEWILEPLHAGNPQRIKELANWFAARDDPATAELLLLSATSRDSLPEAFRLELQPVLKALRREDQIPGIPSMTGGRPDNEELPALRGLTADRAANSPLRIDVNPFMRLPSPEWTELQGGVRLIGLPEHLPLDYYLSGNNASNAVELVSLDPSDGTIRDRIPVTVRIQRQVLAMVPLETGESCPSLFPVADRSRLEMFQLAAPGKAGLLWQRRLSPASKSRTERPVEFGPLGADHLVWAFDGILHGTHPLTGEDLWTRSLPWTWEESPGLRLPRIFGDSIATVVRSSDGAGCERFSTRTGAWLGRGPLPVSRTHEPLAVGRFLAFVGPDGSVQVIDGADGRNLLADEAPIRVSLHHAARTFSRLPRGRIITVSDENELILIDTRRGGIVFRRNIGEYLSTSIVFGLTAFERNGRLFVGLDDEQDRPGDMLVQFNRVADPRLGLGPLLCLDPESGEVLWSVRTERAVVPRIAGDPTDLLVTWTLYRPTYQSRSDGDGDRLNIRVFDTRNGRELASEASLSTAAPFRCSHDADAGVIRLFTRDCEITIRSSHAGASPDQNP